MELMSFCFFSLIDTLGKLSKMCMFLFVCFPELAQFTRTKGVVHF